MHFEVEQKHPVDDPAALAARLAALGVEVGPAEIQIDQYFAHPARDFAETDEALRIRTVGEASFVTYKGPKVDSTTKTRRELELPLGASATGGARFAELLAALGFAPVATVRKERRKFSLDEAGGLIEGALDAVDGVGNFVELELSADEPGVEAARRSLARAAERLGLGPSERRSYLELLLGR